MLAVGWGEAARATSVPWRAPSAAVRGPFAIAWSGERGASHAATDDREAWIVGWTSRGDVGSLVQESASDPMAALARLRGAFIAVLLVPGAAFVAVDPLGARSLVVTHRPGGGLVTEDVATMLDLLPTRPAPDALGLASWIDGRSLPPRTSLLRDVRRVPPGRALRLSRAGAEEVPQWTPRYAEPGRTSHEELVARVGAAVGRAVAASTTDAARPAVQLSGGLDSGTVAACLPAAADGRRRAFGGTFPGRPEADEAAIIRATADRTGCELVLVPGGAGDDLLADAQAHLERWRVPPPSPNGTIWRALLRAAAAAGVDALLTGEGGDEAFGLAWYAPADALRRGQLHRAWRLTGLGPWVGRDRGLRTRVDAFWRLGLLPTVAGLERTVRRPPSPLLDARGRALLRTAPTGLPAASSGPLWWRHQVHQLVGARHAVQASTLFRQTAVAAGLDGRHPLQHDVELVETLIGLPADASYRRGWDRPLQRDAMAERLPAAVIGGRRKARFSFASDEALRGAAGRVLRGELLERRAPVREHVDPDALDALLGRWPALDERSVVSLYGVGMLNRWLEHLAR